MAESGLGDAGEKRSTSPIRPENQGLIFFATGCSNLGADHGQTDNKTVRTMGWNWSPSRNFFSRCFDDVTDEFQRDGEIGRDFSRTSGWNFEVQENKKKDSTPEE